MNKKILYLLFSLLISIVCLTTLAAQNKQPGNAEKISSDFEVRLPVAVLDSKKHFVSNLTLKDFIVLENGRRQKIQSFTDDKNNLPVYVGVLMDTSPSAHTKLKYTKEAAKHLSYTLTRLRKNKTAFMTFDHLISLRQDFTDKIDLLDMAIDKVKESGTQNSLYDAIYQFCDEKLRNAPGRRTIIIISDGKDSYSRANIEDAIDIAQRTETVIYIVSTDTESLKTNSDIKTKELKTLDNKFLFQLTAETGGEVFFADDMIMLDRALSLISKEIKSQYTITYRPKNRKYSVRERRIEVRLTDKKKKNEYKIRTKTKYRLAKEKLK